MSPEAPGALIDLSVGHVGLVVDVTRGVPALAHWGAPGVSPAALHRRPGSFGGLDDDVALTLVPLHSEGFAGRPGLLGHRRGGAAWAPRFGAPEVEVGDDGEGGRRLVTTASDPVARLTLRCSLRLTAGGALVARAELTNDGDERYLLDALSLSLPVPEHAAELLTLSGRWIKEAQLERHPWPSGAWTAENRSGRTSHEHVPVLWAVSPGAGEWHGEVWGAHLAWSGNHTLLAERLPDGRRHLQLGELLHPGELSLGSGESYETPEVVAVHSPAGLTTASWGFHRFVRSRPHHPGVDRPRPVLLNTWEAVYFDHDRGRLLALADVAASVGVERFVLDDGWFGSRRDDRSGLGDWWVSPEAHPDGLAPLIDHVRGLGMEFGIWVEPEMVNPDSDLYRAHPEWVLATDGYEPVMGRNQLVVDLARADAFDHVLGQLDRLLGDHEISFVKWDMNRPHVAASGARGAAGSHHQTLAVWRLLDELRRRHPAVEFESCASGGGRVDLGILARAERVWASDCNDALERQLIQRGWSLLVPPEVTGCHIGPPVAHTTGRRLRLGFRAATALFGHLGLEWNLLDASERDLEVLREVLALHRRFRPLLHGGDAVRFDLAPNGAVNGGSPDALAHGVYAADRSEALLCWAQLTTGASAVPPRWRVPGLDAQREYRVEHVPLPGGAPGLGRSLPSWMEAPITMSGAELAAVGLQPPVLFPATAVLVRLVAA